MAGDWVARRGARAAEPHRSVSAVGMIGRKIVALSSYAVSPRYITSRGRTFEWLLGREYVQMHEVSRERAPTGTPAYEAVVLFGRDPRTGAYACIWMDNTAAAAFPPEGTGRGSVTGDSIPFVFHYTETTSFHTTFVYDRAKDSWQWHMDNDSSGVRRPFARVTLMRR